MKSFLIGWFKNSKSLDISGSVFNFLTTWPKKGGAYMDVLIRNMVLATANTQIPLHLFKAPAALQTPIGSASSTIIGLTAGTFGTSNDIAKTADQKASNVTPKMRIQIPIPLLAAPATGKLRINAGMLTTVSDTTATVDVEVVRKAAPTVDICTTAAQSINSLTAANKDFDLDITDVVPGDVLDIRITIAINDSATATAVYGAINSVTPIWTTA